MDDHESDINVNAPTEGECAAQFVGELGVHFRAIEVELGVAIVQRQGEIRILGPARQVESARKCLDVLAEMAKAGQTIAERDVIQVLKRIADFGAEDPKSVFLDTVMVSASKKRIAPKTQNQKAYVDAIRTHTLVIAIGPAGTGKTYLAMAMAVAALIKKEVSRIILARPAVEAGESLGFLPGDMYQKVNPYLRPLYDALYDMLEVDRANRLVERGVIEIAPIAYMRGRTLNDSFIILDEAQNTTSEQMKMFLTRLGFNCKAVVTGDVTQIDLPKSKLSGLVEIDKVLQGIPDISFIYFDDRDVVRHVLVQRIVRAYERYYASQETK